jgi:hypothetical protein
MEILIRQQASGIQCINPLAMAKMELKERKRARSSKTDYPEETNW